MSGFLRSTVFDEGLAIKGADSQEMINLMNDSFFVKVVFQGIVEHKQAHDKIFSGYFGHAQHSLRVDVVFVKNDWSGVWVIKEFKVLNRSVVI